MEIREGTGRASTRHNKPTEEPVPRAFSVLVCTSTVRLPARAGSITSAFLPLTESRVLSSSARAASLQCRLAG